MKDYKEFEPTIPYPKKEDYKRIKVFVADDGEEYNHYYYDEDGFKKAKEAYAQSSREGLVRFSEALFQEYCPDWPIGLARCVYSRAWDEGHSYGMYEVEAQFQRLVEFTKDCINEYKKGN